MLLPTKMKSLRREQPKQFYDAFRGNQERFQIFGVTMCQGFRGV